MKITLGFGSNLGDRKNIILQAYELLEEKLGKKTQESTMIETEAWGFESENLFLNSVAVFETDKTPRESLVICNEIEALLGRRRNPNATTYENRPIDIDILFYENEIIDEIDLKIPHPLIPQRDFVLIPLKELMPNFVHPVLNKAIKEL
ncbi:MAG: 2-amino-4-hydroxy-6-hydroxymethyldihydropteridine diphosphokinase [Bacteroidales bacterium]|nr:2-amino-4-hydroxy-6-hydroxymethyldihydropteridine diphosphokinase [Bacteroidales bacterium]